MYYFEFSMDIYHFAYKLMNTQQTVNTISILQVLCHELGCLPVSKLCGLPGVTELLESDGTPKDAEHRMLKQLPELLTQLEWMAVAMKSQR